MASNFKAFSFVTKGGLHIKLSGDFDVTSAQELINTLLTHGTSYWDIFIDTNDLETVHSFGRDTLKMNLRNFKNQLNNLFFIGANRFKIAPI